MAEHIRNVNHCILAVRDLEVARARFASLGFTLTPRGRHPHRGTGNYCVMFPDNYVELLGVIHKDGHEPLVEKQLAKGEGIGGLAFDTDDVKRAFEQMTSRGVEAAEPFQAQRDIELETGPVSVRFQIVRIGADSSPYLSTFLCRHLDAGIVYRPDFLHHDNGVTTINEFIVVVPELLGVAERYERLFGEGKTRSSPEETVVNTGNCDIRFVTAARAARLVPVGQPAGPLPQVVRIVFRADVPDRVADHARRLAIPVSRSEAGGVLIGSDHGFGVALEFTPRERTALA